MLLAFPPHITECLTIINRTAIAFRSSSVRWRRKRKRNKDRERKWAFHLFSLYSPLAAWEHQKKAKYGMGKKRKERKEKIKTETTDETGLMDANNLQGSLDIYKGCLRSWLSSSFFSWFFFTDFGNISFLVFSVVKFLEIKNNGRFYLRVH